MAFYTPRERHIADLHEAFRTESIDRRTFFKVAGAAAVATGLSHGAVPTVAGPWRAVRAQPAANTLVYGSPQDISNLDPHTGHDYSIAWGQKAVYDALLRYEGNPGELKPLLATEVIGSPDATTWTIKLADNATFHDGSAVTAEAVQYNFQRMLRKNLGVAWMFATAMDQDSVEVVDETTLNINLLKPFAPYDAVLPWLFVANPTIVQEHDVDGDEGEAWLKENEAGGGPYTIARWELGSSYEFTRYPDYWFDPELGPDAAAFKERSLAASDAVQLEDVGICESVQRGIASAGYRPGPYAPALETGAFLFHRLLAQAVQAAAKSAS